MILAPLQKLPKNVGDLGKFIVAKGFKKLPKVQKIANSGHTAHSPYSALGPLPSIGVNGIDRWWSLKSSPVGL